MGVGVGMRGGVVCEMEGGVEVKRVGGEGRGLWVLVGVGWGGEWGGVEEKVFGRCEGGGGMGVVVMDEEGMEGLGEGVRGV